MTRAPGGPRAAALPGDRSFQDSKNRPYLHLVDGGVSDNLGMRGVLEALEEIEASPAFQREAGYEDVRRIVVFVVNSLSVPKTDWDRGERAGHRRACCRRRACRSTTIPTNRSSC